MGKKEQIAELNEQLKMAKKKRRTGSIGIFSGLVVCFVFLPLGIFILIISIIYLITYGNKINTLKYEQTKLK